MPGQCQGPHVHQLMAQRYTGEMFKGCYDAVVRTTASLVVSRSAVPPKVASRKIRFARTLEPTVMEYFRSGNGILNGMIR